MKGYGFLEPEDGSADVFCHLTAVQASGHETLPQGAAVTCEIVSADRGLQVSRFLDVGVPSAPGGGTTNGPPRPGPHAPVRQYDGAAEVARTVQGTVKFYDPMRGLAKARSINTAPANPQARAELETGAAVTPSSPSNRSRISSVKLGIWDRSRPSYNAKVILR